MLKYTPKPEAGTPQQQAETVADEVAAISRTFAPTDQAIFLTAIIRALSLKRDRENRAIFADDSEAK